MDKFIEKIYLNEIIKQANRALFCVNAINNSVKSGSNEDVFREIEHFIQHASAISLLLWNNKKKEKDRCRYLKEKLKIDGTNILSKRDLRNHLVHFDERLGKWAKNSNRHIFVDQNIGDVQNMVAGVEQTDIIRNYDPRNANYSFCGENFDIQSVVQEIEKIEKSAQDRKAVLSNIRNKKGEI